MATIKANQILISQLTDKEISRFMSYQKKGTAGECIEWTAGTTGGYGYMYLSHFGTMVRCNRIGYAIEHGETPENMIVMHTCDNPSCVNPKHLVIGTSSDNTKDCFRKGRHKTFRTKRGEGHYKAKLTNEKVRDIVRRYAYDNETIVSLAKEYGVSPQTITQVVSLRTWKDVIHPAETVRILTEKEEERRIGKDYCGVKGMQTAEDVIARRQEYGDGTSLVSYTQLARKYGVSLCTAYKAVTGQTWKDVE